MKVALAANSGQLETWRTVHTAGGEEKNFWVEML